MIIERSAADVEEHRPELGDAARVDGDAALRAEIEALKARLDSRSDELKRIKNDFRNLVEAAELAAVVVDPAFVIRRFTASAGAALGLSSTDAGRRLTDCAALDLRWAAEAAAEVAAGGAPAEREIDAPDGRAYLARLAAYRDGTDAVDGAVLSLVDVTRRRASERRTEAFARRVSEHLAELETLYDTAPIGLSLMDRDLRWVRVNERLAEINGLPVSAHLGRRHEEILPDIAAKTTAVMRQVLDTGRPAFGIEVRGVTPAAPDRPRDWVVDYYPVFDGERVFALGCCVRETTERNELIRKLAESERRLLLALEVGGVGLWSYSPAHGRLEASDRFEEIIGGPAAMEDGLDGLFSRIAARDREAVSEQLSQAIASGERWRGDFRVILPDGGTRHVEAAAQPFASGDGSAVAIGVALDVTERRQAENRMAVLLGELQHRVRNTLATILAVVRFTARASETTEQMAESLSDRLGAIARSHDVLTANDWRGDSLREVFLREVAPYCDGRPGAARFEGEDIRLSAKHALAMALALHELATNAAKHGALSRPGGVVSLTAESREDGGGRVVWAERGGPPVSAPGKSTGFGRFLLERALAADLGGACRLGFDPEGVSCEIEIAPAREG